MVLTRKQAWRRVRVVRHVGAHSDTCAVEMTREDSAAAAAAAAKKPLAGDWMRQVTQRPQHRPSEPQTISASPREHRSDSSSSDGSSSCGSSASSPNERTALDNWRLPKEGRKPSARPGVSAARRQAMGACVRVGSRVSFNTVVAAILIPSAKDLHSAARQQLWWQETDYRDFRINFIQFMRSPPEDAADVPDVVPVVEIARETKPIAEKDQKTADDVQQLVVVDAVVYEDAAPGTEEVCAWPVSSADVKNSASSSSLSDADTSPPTPPVEQETPTSSNGDESDESVEIAVVGVSCAASSKPPPLPLLSSSTMSISSDDNGGEGSQDGATTAVDATVSDQAVRRQGSTGAISEKSGGSCNLGWSSSDEGNDADEEMDDDGNTVRSRRSFSNLETARRGGAGLTTAIPSNDLSDFDENSDDVESGSASGSDTGGRRPRALSLDGWFTCGLENGLDTKSYETHDHAGRLRDLVKLDPLPVACATPPLAKSVSYREVDLNDALRRLRLMFDVSVNGDVAKMKAYDESGHVTGGSQCRPENSGITEGRELSPSSSTAPAASAAGSNSFS